MRASNYCSHIILKRLANCATTCLCTCHRSVLHSVVCGRGEARLPSKLETQLMTVAFYAYLPQVKRTNAVLITSRTLCLGLGKWDCDMRGVRGVIRLSVRTMHYVQMFSTRTSSSHLCSFIHDLIIHPMSSKSRYQSHPSFSGQSLHVEFRSVISKNTPSNKEICFISGV